MLAMEEIIAAASAVIIQTKAGVSFLCRSQSRQTVLPFYPYNPISATPMVIIAIPIILISIVFLVMCSVIKPG